MLYCFVLEQRKSKLFVIQKDLSRFHGNAAIEKAFRDGLGLLVLACKILDNLPASRYGKRQVDDIHTIEVEYVNQRASSWGRKKIG